MGGDPSQCECARVVSPLSFMIKVIMLSKGRLCGRSRCCSVCMYSSVCRFAADCADPDEMDTAVCGGFAGTAVSGPNCRGVVLLPAGCSACWVSKLGPCCDTYETASCCCDALPGCCSLIMLIMSSMGLCCPSGSCCTCCESAGSSAIVLVVVGSSALRPPILLEVGVLDRVLHEVC